MQIALLLLAVALLVFLVVRRKKAEVSAPAKPEPAPVAAMEAAGPSEQYGPSLDEVEPEEPEVEPEPDAEVEPELVVTLEPEPFVVPEVVVEPEPVALEPEALAPEPEPEPVIELGPQTDGVLEISYPAMTDEAPPGLSVDAFKDIKPVAFGGVAVEETQSAPEPGPDVQPEPEPVVEVHPEPIVEAPPIRDFEPLTYPGVEDVPPVEPELALEPELELEPEAETPAAIAETAVAEPAVEDAKPKKRGFRMPNPQLKLPSFGKKGSLKLPQITLPANLQGPLSEVERKIALGCVLAIVAAGALGYKTAPSDDAGAPAPTAAPAAASR